MREKPMGIIKKIIRRVSKLTGKKEEGRLWSRNKQENIKRFRKSYSNIHHLPAHPSQSQRSRNQCLLISHKKECTNLNLICKKENLNNYLSFLNQMMLKLNPQKNQNYKMKQIKMHQKIIKEQTTTKKIYFCLKKSRNKNGTKLYRC